MRDETAVSIRAHAIALAALTAAIGLVYASSFEAGFVLDSRAQIVDNPMVHAATWQNVRYLLTHDYWQPFASGGLYRPLTSISYLVDYSVLGNGARPAGYHAVNVLLHLTCTILVYALLWRLTRRPWATMVGAALFALHPIATEAVTNIIGRADLLAALGVLAGMFLHLHARAARGARRGVCLVALAIAAAIALFAKESGAVLLPALLLLDATRARGEGRRPAWSSYLAVLPALAMYLALRLYAQSNSPAVEPISPIDNPLVEAGFWPARLTALQVLGLGMRLLVWPAHLSADYSYAAIVPMPWPPSAVHVAAALAPLALAAALGFWFRRERAFLFFLAFYFLALLPSANLVVLVGSVMAERFLYLPLFGFAGVVGLLVERAAGVSVRSARAVAVGAAVALVLVTLGVRTAQRNRDWNDELSLWRATVRVVPESAKAQKAFANALALADRSGAHLDAVLASAERAVAIRGDYAAALVDLGGYYVRAGDAVGGEGAAAWYERAAGVLERAQQQGRGNALLANNLALAYARQGRFEQALAPYEELIRLEPDAPGSYVDRSAMLANLGRLDDSAAALWQALAVRPGYPDAINRLIVLYRLADPQTTAVRIDAAGSPHLVLEDPRVVRDRCRAYRDLADVFARALRPAQAAEAAGVARHLCGT